MSNLIHRIWMGDPMPEKFAQYGEDWAKLNPEYECHEWGEEEIMDSQWENVLVLQDMYAKSKQPGADMVAYYTHVADVVDYELIYNYGGWYFNTDLKPIKPLDTLDHPMNSPGFAMEDDVHPVNMAMYAPPNHPLFSTIIRMLPQRYFGMPGAFMNATTGVQLIEQALSQHIGGVVKYHRDVFNPIHWGQFGYGEEPNIERAFPEETIAVHLWGHRTNQRGQRILET